MTNRSSVIFCTLCERWTIKCGDCEMGGCAGGHLYFCRSQKQSDSLDRALQFFLAKTNLEDLLNEQAL